MEKVELLPINQQDLGILVDNICHKLFIAFLLIFQFQCQKKSSFIEEHWNLTYGNPPYIQPELCGHCHPVQWNAYKNSRHSKSMSSGFVWQLFAMNNQERIQCYNCHSYGLLSSEINLTNYKNLNNYSIQCSTCHIREKTGIRKFFGPPLSKEITFNEYHSIPHSLEIRKEFEDEKFCIHCHTTPNNGQKVNNKLLMNIYEDWKNSPFSKENNYKTCQNCHMPQREHSWKGIFDKEFVLDHINIQWDPNNKNLKIFNNKIGHKFPAYSVPRIQIILKNGLNEILLKEIGWKLDIFLKKEEEDSRIPSGNYFEYTLPRDTLKNIKSNTYLQIYIHPSYHYEKSFEYTLENLILTEIEKELIKIAIKESKDSRYLLWEKKL